MVQDKRGTAAGLVRVALAASALFAGAAGPEPLEAPAVLARLERWLAETRDLEGRFTQTLVSGALGPASAESGRLWVERPGRMRWDYLEPERKVALVDGGRTRLYLAEERQLWEGRLADAGSLLPLLFSGERALSDLFEASLVAAPAEPGTYVLRLAPRGSGESFQELVLTLHTPEFALEEFEVLDAAGNRLLYRFTHLRRNRGLPKSTFRFEPPPGTEIVAESAPSLAP